MNKHSWQYRYRVQRARNVWAEPVKRTDNLSTAIRAANQWARDIEAEFYVFDCRELRRVFLAKPAFLK